MIRHAGLIALFLKGRWRGALIEGPSGAGKSDLALRAMAQGFRLAADDRVITWASGGRLFGRAPDSLSGRIEVRGLDVVRVDALAYSPIVLVARCGDAERIPEPEHDTLDGVRLPVLRLDLRAPSAPAKLRHAIDAFDAASKRRI